MANDLFLLSLTGVGIWNVAPPTLRLLTSTAGVMFATAFFQISSPSSDVFSEIISMES